MFKFLSRPLKTLAIVIASFAIFSSNFVHADEEGADFIDQTNQFSQQTWLEEILSTDAETFINADQFSISEAEISKSHSDKRSLRLRITMSAPSILGTVPAGYNIDVTPLVISPCGQIYRGEPTNIFLTNAAIIQPLNEVFIPKLIEGVYTVGYQVSLGAGSPVAVSLGALLSSVVLTEDVFGFRQETINSNVLAFTLSDLTQSTDILYVTSNCQLVDPRRCNKNGNCIAVVDGSLLLNMNLSYSLSSGSVPTGVSFNFTPFVVSPNGKVFKGVPTTLVLTASNFAGIPLNPVSVPRLVKGNYFVGYEISLASGSPIAAANVNYNFFGSIRSNPVGLIRESTTYPTQLLPLGALMGLPSDVFRVTGNFLVE